MYFDGFILHLRTSFAEYQMYFTLQRPVFHYKKLFLKASLHSISM